MGGQGDDLFIANAGDDIVAGGEGNDTLNGTRYNDIFLIYNGEVTYMYAGAGDDTVLGSQADDILIGGTGNDQIGGLDGDDLISTGVGFDFVFVDRDTSLGPATGDGYDVVSDFGPVMDMLIVQQDGFSETYDSFADLSQTAQGYF